MHRLLKRQLGKCFPEGSQPPGLETLLPLVNDAYAAADTDREMLERSMAISSRELLEANVELRAVLGAFPDLFLWVQVDGRIVETQSGNQEDPDLSGVGLVGRSLATFPNVEVGRRLQAQLERTQASNQVGSLEYEIARGAERLIYDTRVFPIENQSVLVIVRNVTNTKRVELAEAANRAKGDFLANMSHELRTPLHGILSFARFGKKRASGVADPKLHGYFETIEESGQTLLEILDEVLDLAKLDAGLMRFEFGPVDLGQIIARELDQFRSRVHERGLAVVSREGCEQLDINADAQRIAQVLRNVLANAVKFSPEHGRVEIAVDEQPDLVRISVTDEGPGVPTDELEAIFEKFVQSTRTNSGAGGTGLGLAICRQIVQAHYGRIWAENASPGTRIVIELPRSVLSQARAA